MDNLGFSHKKRRHDNNYNSKYQQRYKKNSREEARNWRPDNYRGGGRYSGHLENVGRNFRETDKKWDVEINLIGRKVKDLMIHVCEICSLPIKSYGRMIPCKHVFCFCCAQKTDSNCPRCKDPIQRIEQCRLGSVWLCSATAACKRTYLSQRDLQAHINHRHHKPHPPSLLPPPLVLPPVSVPPPPITVPPPQLIQPPLSDAFLIASTARAATSTPAPSCAPPPPSVDINPRPSSNLITIQIHDNESQSFPPPPSSERPPNQPQLYSTQAAIPY